jgi:hypothetical protein
MIERRIGLAITHMSGFNMDISDIDKLMTHPLVRSIVLVILCLFMWTYTTIGSLALFSLLAYLGSVTGVMKWPEAGSPLFVVLYTLCVLVVSAYFRMQYSKKS